MAFYFYSFEQNAAYLAENQGLSVTDAVLDIMSKSGYSNQTGKKTMIQSSDSSVLKKFKSSSDYGLVYQVDEDFRDILLNHFGDKEIC